MLMESQVTFPTKHFEGFTDNGVAASIHKAWVDFIYEWTVSLNLTQHRLDCFPSLKLSLVNLTTCQKEGRVLNWKIKQRSCLQTRFKTQKHLTNLIIFKYFELTRPRFIQQCFSVHCFLFTLAAPSEHKASSVRVEPCKTNSRWHRPMWARLWASTSQ